MQVIRIELTCEINIVISAAAYTSDALYILIVFKDTHQSCDTALDRSFINDFRIGDAGLRERILNVVEHDGDRFFTSN